MVVAGWRPTTIFWGSIGGTGRFGQGRPFPPCTYLQLKLGSQATNDDVLEVQRLRTSEGDRLRKLRLDSLGDSPRAFSGTYEEAAARSPAQWCAQIEALPTFVAVSNHSDVGLVRAAPLEDNPGVAFLLSLWVAPEVRGEGVGEALIDALVDWGRTAGVVRLMLDVGDTNEPAFSLYARMGFKKTGETSTLDHVGDQISEIRMARDL